MAELSRSTPKSQQDAEKQKRHHEPPGSSLEAKASPTNHFHTTRSEEHGRDLKRFEYVQEEVAELFEDHSPSRVRSLERGVRLELWQGH